MKPSAARRARSTPGTAWLRCDRSAPWKRQSWKGFIEILMSSVPHIPALRLGRAYESLDQTTVADCCTGVPLASISQVNAGIIRKDLARVAESRAALKKFTTAQLTEIS